MRHRGSLALSSLARLQPLSDEELTDIKLALTEACDRFKGMRFEPMGGTSNPDIPECSSILDYVARYLDREFGNLR